MEIQNVKVVQYRNKPSRAALIRAALYLFAPVPITKIKSTPKGAFYFAKDYLNGAELREESPKVHLNFWANV